MACGSGTYSWVSLASKLKFTVLLALLLDTLVVGVGNLVGATGVMSLFTLLLSLDEHEISMLLLGLDLITMSGALLVSSSSLLSESDDMDKFNGESFLVQLRGNDGVGLPELLFSNSSGLESESLRLEMAVTSAEALVFLISLSLLCSILFIGCCSRLFFLMVGS